MAISDMSLDAMRLVRRGPDAVGEQAAALFALAENTLCLQPVKTRFGVHVVRSGRRVEGRQLPFDIAQPIIAEYLEEASYRRAVAQYIAVLAENAGVSGVTLA